MPQLDFSNVLTISQVVWMLLIFGVLYFLLSQWALPQVGGVLADRDARIAADLDSAKLAKADADRAIADVREATRRARTEAQAAVTAAADKAKAEAAQQAQQANEQLDKQLAEAEQRIAAAHEEAMNALRDVAKETTGLIVTRLTKQKANQKAIDAAVGDVLAERS